MKVSNFDHLKELATSENDDTQSFYILLAGGIARSSKRIKYYPNSDLFEIVHEIDDSFQEISGSDLANDTFFKQAIEFECFFMASSSSE